MFSSRLLSRTLILITFALFSSVYSTEAQKAGKTGPSIAAKSKVASQIPARFDPAKLKSVKELEAYIKSVKPVRKYQPKSVAQATGKRKAKTGFLEAYLYFMRQRAYPNDSFDFGSYVRARAHRAGMPRAGGAAQAKSGIGVRAIGGRWEFVGPQNLPTPYRIYFGEGATSGRVNGVAFDPRNNGTYYVAAAGGGLWKTTDQGQIWTALGDAWPALTTSCVVVDPRNPNTVYCGTGDFHGFGQIPAAGVMKSTDGGASWTALGLNAFGTLGVSKIVIDPDNSNNLVVTTGSPLTRFGRVWRSTDGGGTWNQVIAVDAFWSGAHYGAPNAGGQRRLYAVGIHNGGHVWRSDDRGATWTRLSPPLSAAPQYGIDVAASQAAPDTVYLLSSFDERIYKSVDAGSNWTDVSAGFPTGGGYNWSQYWYNYHISTSTRPAAGGGLEDVVYVGQIDIAQSISGGTSWQSVGGPTYDDFALTHNDQHSLAVNPQNPNDVLIGNDGGVYRFNFDPATNTFNYDPLSRTLGITQFYKAAFHPTDPTKMIGGTQDNATPAAVGDLSNWINVGGGDGGGSAINPLNPRIQYATVYGAGIWRTDDEWATNAWIAPNTGFDNSPFVTPLTVDPSNPHLVYLGTNYLYRWNDQTLGWTPRLGNQPLSTNGVIQTIAVAPTDGQRIYTGSDDGQAWMTMNGGTTWTNIRTGNPSLPNRAITAIDVDPRNPNRILVTVSGSGTPHVWRCDNASAANRVWINASGAGAASLPDTPANAVAFDPFESDGTYYVGTDIGVFQTRDNGQTWTDASAPLGLPNVMVTDLKAVTGTGYLMAATYGRGIWRIELTAPVFGIVSINVSPSAVNAGSPATATVTMNGPAPAGGVVVTLQSSDPSIASMPPSVTIPEGERTASVPVTTAAQVFGGTVVTLSATYLDVTVQTNLTIVPLIAGVEFLDPFFGAWTPYLPVIGGTLVTGRVRLTEPAKEGGQVIELESDDTSLAQVTPSVTVQAGRTVQTFLVWTYPTPRSTPATITGTADGSSNVGIVDVLAPAPYFLSIDPLSVTGGTRASATVWMDGPAPPQGLTVNVTSSHEAAMAPATVRMDPGKDYSSFDIPTKVVAGTVVAQITAEYEGFTASNQLTIRGNGVRSLTFSPTVIPGGSFTRGTVILTDRAPAGGTSIILSKNDPLGALGALPSVTVPQGAISTTFTVTSNFVASDATVPVTAGIAGQTPGFTASVTVEAVGVKSVTIYPLTMKANTSTPNAYVFLNGGAPAGGAVVQLTATAGSVPATVFIPQGATSVRFTYTAPSTVPPGAKAVVTATYPAGKSRSATVTIFP